MRGMSIFKNISHQVPQITDFSWVITKKKNSPNDEKIIILQIHLRIARFLSLPEAESYIGHSFRRVSVTPCRSKRKHYLAFQRDVPVWWMEWIMMLYHCSRTLFT